MMASKFHNDWQSNKNTILERNSYMFNNPLMSDITLTCGTNMSQCFYAHKYVLATSSPVFYAMFYGDLAESNSILHLPDIDEESLREFLRFLYTEECTLTLETAVAVMYLGKKYIVPCLVEKCAGVLHEGMDPENILPILEQMILFDEKKMEKQCWEVIEKETLAVVTSESFVDLSHKTLVALLKRRTLSIEPIDLFHVVLTWTTNQCWELGLDESDENKRAVLGEGIFELPFQSMTSNDLLQYVSTSGLLTDDEFVALWEHCNVCRKPIAQQIHSVSHDLQYVSRFTQDNIKPPTSAWSYGNRPDRISFSTSLPGLLHGIRLFGDDDGGKYEVSLQVNGTSVDGRYISEPDDHGVYGFNVMLHPPLSVAKDMLMNIEVCIQGPNSYYGNNGQALANTEGVTVAFKDAPGASNGTNVRQGQFHYVILSF